ncbi:Cell division protein FtsI [Peptidoglycan synthetase] [hydrothermal vent metagenome]|uniref:Cell division protein FtsI [Peptidoglycan synthetase] n=1 Tax=hydrothermal vent metagenome TaxID=652676 RepID=A0A3B0Y9W8_9ZZZZ
MRTRPNKIPEFLNRRYLMMLVFLVMIIALFLRATWLQVIERDFLTQKGSAQHMKLIKMHAYRGMVTDRLGDPLAISTPIHAVCLNLKISKLSNRQFSKLASILGISVRQLKRIKKSVFWKKRQQKEFAYVKRQVRPTLARRVMALNYKGVYLKREFKRYYPTGSTTAHVVGFTNFKDVGKERIEVGAEGVERVYNRELSGIPGSKRVHKSRDGRYVESVERIRTTLHGKPLALSIDHRLQYLAYRELKSALRKYRAKSGSLVIMDVRNGEVLAMVNGPSFNPNKTDRRRWHGNLYRNRAVTDPLEPGSTIKPFVIAAALNAGIMKVNTRINTSPGTLRLPGKYIIRDIHNHGMLNLTNILAKSSNVGISRVAFKVGASRLWKQYQAVGFGHSTRSGYSGETGGKLSSHKKWGKTQIASHSIGYSLYVTPLQLAQAYVVLGSGGFLKPVAMLRQKPWVQGKRVMSPRVATDVVRMMEKVVSEKGTGKLAHVQGYRVAGKTGTARIVKKVNNQRIYSDRKHRALFAGMAPASSPRLVIVVVINEPKGKEYSGGAVAAPIFARVMKDALRILNVSPDKMPISHKTIKIVGGRS